MTDHLAFDGWVRKHKHRGILFRRNPLHVEMCIEAIRRRWDAETEVFLRRETVKQKVGA